MLDSATRIQGTTQPVGRRLIAGAAAVLMVLASVGTVVLAGATPAGASTVNGVATIAAPGQTTPLTGGGSNTPFTVVLPAQAACDGDTATGGYHVYSYLVQKGTALSGVTFVGFPSVGYGLVDNTGNYYGPVNTAIGTGQIVGIPNNFEWGPWVSDQGLTASDFLYSGSGDTASGVWEAGLACANSSGALVDNWNTEVTFNASSSDPNGFTWTAVPGTGPGAPTVSSVSPSSGPTAGGTAVTITGTNLSGATAVDFESNAATSVDVVSSTSITATSPAGSAGVTDVTVTTPAGTSTIGSPDHFTYIAAPTVTAVSPSSGPTAGGTGVTITGTNLTGATTVDFGATAATSVVVVSSTSITATSPTGSAGVVDVTVTTPGGTSTTGSPDEFTYVAAPTVSSVSPASGPTGGGTGVTITGTNLTGATGVKFGTASATSVVVVSSTSVTATSPAGAAGVVDVTVTTPGGTSAASPTDEFTYGLAPTVAAVTPNTGPTAGGTGVTITGANLTGATAVDFGTNAATSVVVVSGTSITATSPAGAAGVVDVTVTTPNGTSTTGAGDHFTYAAAPTVTAVSPATGPTAGGTGVTITGTNLTGATVVDFGSSPATSVHVVSSTSVTATSPAGPAGVVDVTVTTPGGTSTTGAGTTSRTSPPRP